ncbi:DUF1754-domain-containing protein [Ramaria rubella]|nr:DUF1754-domain-containing protein [Ramaria rubella]
MINVQSTFTFQIYRGKLVSELPFRSRDDTVEIRNTDNHRSLLCQSVTATPARLNHVNTLDLAVGTKYTVEMVCNFGVETASHFNPVPPPRMSDYDFRPGGSLKLKGVADGGVTKKKKKSSKSKNKEKTDTARARLQETGLDEADKTDTPSGSGRNSPAIGGRKTEAEKRFEEMQRERLAKRVTKMANKTHKDRVNDFNNKLEALSEHHDIPKVGPG